MYDVAIIGAGPAGIAAAKLSSKYGLKTILLEKEKKCFGGTCLNTGCIPTKFFLNSSKINKNWQETIIGKDQLVENIKTPLLKYLENKGVAVQFGETSFIDINTLLVGDNTISAKNIIIATGSVPKKITTEKKCIVAEDLFRLSDLPPKVLIVGGGYIGIEFASMLSRFDREVTVIEKENRILPLSDAYFAKRLRIILENGGIKIHTGKSLSDCNVDDFDIIILAIGRSAQVKQLKVDNINLSVCDGGWIKTDEFLRTNIPNVYACGDITGKKLLAYIGEYQGSICVENIMGKKVGVDYQGIGECVFSIPQMASVGILEDEAKTKNIEYRVIKSNFLKYSSAHVYNDTNGFIEIVMNLKNKIIGAGIISNSACELISLFSYCIKNNMSLDSLEKCTFIHPTLSEIIPLLAKEGK
ncbi:MAG: NAD(P)/FAD-dependent oxidoreductase [Candidatus Omnitrophica bacterium]|nr:NAD(P)/FAD-dependent oxidoreductase [Candidatus Omnitrophota bacterium]